MHAKIKLIYTTLNILKYYFQNYVLQKKKRDHRLIIKSGKHIK